VATRPQKRRTVAFKRVGLVKSKSAS
jgi:hypothetical protein